jgi:hypothetical protein
MKPVVSSLVALALALAPMTATAKPNHKTVHAAKHKPKKAAEKADKTEKEEKAPITRVKAGKKDGASVKPAVHHAHNVDLAGAGHKEPKVGYDGTIVPASLTTKSAPQKAKPAKPELPKLPNAGKPSKGGTEKGTRKAAEKKSESAADDGEPARDEELAELVARIRGAKSSADGDDDAKPANVMHDTRAAKVAPDGAPRTRGDMTTRECSKDPVEIVRGPEVERFALTKCDGSVAPLAIEQLSILIRPGGTARPTAPIAELAKKSGNEIAHGIRRVDPRLVERIQMVAEHFGKPGAPAKLFVISGYRPASVGSMHSSGRAVDLRVEGAKNEEVVAFCKTLTDTGCGFYPNSSFVHVDVRDAGAGHVSWIDASGPGETPRYVTQWPPPIGDSALKPTSMHDLASEGAALLRANRPFDEVLIGLEENP